jgi:hypothetical protein
VTTISLTLTNIYIWEYETIVEDRLPLLIQKQLQVAIQKQPPLFPWETEVDEYETTEPEFGNPKDSIPTSSPEPTPDS